VIVKAFRGSSRLSRAVSREAVAVRGGVESLLRNSGEAAKSVGPLGEQQ
jgi:hypothetical protein